MRAAPLLVLAVVSALAASCSFTGLDHFRVQPCGQCDVLNRRDALDPNGCRVWQCDPTDQFCVLGARDHDHDGHAPIRCGGTDCDDENRMSGQGAAETCDGIDNDCNGIVDDVSGAVPAPTTTTVLTDAPSPSVVAYGEAADGVVVSWRSATMMHLGLVDHVDTTSTSVVLSGVTNAVPSDALASATSAPGCPDATFTTLLPASCEGGAACPGTQICVVAPDGAHVCEAPVTNNTPPHAMECRTHAECQDGLECNGRERCTPTAPAGTIDARGCAAASSTSPCPAAAACDEVRDACVVASISPCTFADVAVAPLSGSEWIGGVVSTDGCAVGRMRLGTVDASASAPSLRLWGDSRLSTTWLGVDVDDAGCTGRSRAASAMHGAAGVAVAGLPFDPVHGRPIPQALAAWRAAPLCTLAGSCTPPQTSAPVEVIGLWRELGDAGGSPISWVDGTGNGTPVRLSDDAIGEHVSVASWSLPGGAAGYTVAYPRMGGGIALAFVHAASSSTTAPLAPICMAPLPPVCLAPEQGTDMIIGSADDGESRTRIAAPGTTRTTPALAMPVAEVLDASAAPVGDVSITIGLVHAGDTTVPLAMAWASATEVVVARATFDPATETLTDGDRVRVAAAGATDVSIVHLTAGLAERDARMPMREAGGLVVTWSTVTGTYALRLSDTDGMPVAPGAVRLGDATEHPRAFLDVVPASGGTAAASFARVVAHRGDQFLAFPSVCGPPS